jgi:hypothetical protein
MSGILLDDGDQANWFPRPRKSSAAIALSSDLCAPKGNETRLYALSASGFAGGLVAIDHGLDQRGAKRAQRRGDGRPQVVRRAGAEAVGAAGLRIGDEIDRRSV